MQNDAIFPLESVVFGGVPALREKGDCRRQGDDQIVSYGR